MDALVYIQLLQCALGLGFSMAKKIKEKKKDDGKIDENEAMEIAKDMLPELLECIIPYVRKDK